MIIPEQNEKYKSGQPKEVKIDFIQRTVDQPRSLSIRRTPFAVRRVSCIGCRVSCACCDHGNAADLGYKIRVYTRCNAGKREILFRVPLTFFGFL